MASRMGLSGDRQGPRVAGFGKGTNRQKEGRGEWKRGWKVALGKERTEQESQGAL